MLEPLLTRFVIVAIALIGLFLFLMALRRLWGRRFVFGTIEGLTGLLLLALSMLAGALFINLLTYDRLTRERPVAEIRFQARAPQLFWAYVAPVEKDPGIYEMRGDEWQMDARVLKWHPMALVFGFDTVYRLDRLSGRYHDIRQETSEPRTVYSLSDEPGLDIWSLVRRHARWIPWVDALYGSATFMPMVDGARYGVFISASGLLARPQNDIAKEALSGWR
jgi:hypothetical protein